MIALPLTLAAFALQDHQAHGDHDAHAQPQEAPAEPMDHGTMDHGAMDHAAMDHGVETVFPGGFAASDLAFLQQMAVHHRQALAMVALIETRSDRPEFAAFGRLLSRGQDSEIRAMEHMETLLRERGVPAPPPMDMKADPPMAGMLSRAQMAALENSAGRKFETLWLEGMIMHHQGAIDMAQAHQLRLLDAGRHPFGIETMLDEIIESQRAEIATMRDWLDEWQETDSQ